MDTTTVIVVLWSLVVLEAVIAVYIWKRKHRKEQDE